MAEVVHGGCTKECRVLEPVQVELREEKSQLEADQYNHRLICWPHVQLGVKDWLLTGGNEFRASHYSPRLDSSYVWIIQGTSRSNTLESLMYFSCH